jgi:hypothetical protein
MEKKKHMKIEKFEHDIPIFSHQIIIFIFNYLYNAYLLQKV